MSNGGRPDFLVICGDHIGISDLSCGDRAKADSFTVVQVTDKLLAGIASREP